MGRTLKTAISLDRDLHERARALAGELGVNRSRLFAMALDEFLRRHENRRLLERLNRVYTDPANEEERATLDGILTETTRLEDNDW